MLNDLHYILNFIGEGFLNIWPYLLISIPLAVVIRVTDASQYIQRIFTGHPVKMILLATVVGAFSPFCACSVIPVIASLLVAGVPLAPVMSFWIASPSMDPEIFFLSVGVLGWDLAVARVVATLLLSLVGGFITLRLDQQYFFSHGILRDKRSKLSWTWRDILQAVANLLPRPATPMHSIVSLASIEVTPTGAACGVGSTQSIDCGCNDSCSTETLEVDSTHVRRKQIITESVSVTWMLVQFMVFAFLLEAIILLYVPQKSIIKLVGEDNPLSIIIMALVGIPVYTTNLTALPLISGLLEQGLAPGAALTFLIAGPTTTIPAMSAVYGITKRRVFVVYLGLTFVGAVLLGYSYQLLSMI